MTSSLTAEQETSSDPTQLRPRPVAPRRRRLRERISLGHLFMIAAGLLAFVLVVSLLQDRTRTVKVLAARNDIFPGAAVSADQVKEISIPAGSPLAPSMATMASLGGGATAAQRIKAGDPITLTALSPQTNTSGRRAMSIPIDRSRAVGGDLAPGDRVDVIAVNGTEATYVAVDLEVLRTQAASGGGALSSSSINDYYVTVSVDDKEALGIALALQTGKVSILRSTGATPVPSGQRALVGQPAATGLGGPATGASSPAANSPSSGQTSTGSGAGTGATATTEKAKNG